MDPLWQNILDPRMKPVHEVMMLFAQASCADSDEHMHEQEHILHGTWCV